jgi:hypothetical protein
MVTRLAQFGYLMLYALVAGVFWGTWLSLARTMTSYDAATFLSDGKHMIANLAGVMPVLMILTAVLGVVVVVALFRIRSTAAGWLALLALVLLGAVFAVTLAVEVPIDNQIKTWTTSTLPPDWGQTRARWAHFHTLRTFLSLAGLAAAIAAPLASPVTPRATPADRHQVANAARS